MEKISGGMFLLASVRGDQVHYHPSDNLEWRKGQHFVDI